MVVVGTIEIWTDVHAFHPQFTVDDGAVCIHQTGLTQSDALYLRTSEDDAGSKGLDEEIFERGLSVFYLYGAFLPQ